MTQVLGTLSSSLSEYFLNKEFIATDYELLPYKIKLTTPLRTATSRRHYRQGLVIKLIVNKSLSAFGECAPMAEIGTEALSQAEYFLQSKMPSLIGKPLDTDILSDMDSLPACRFALESALLTLMTAQNNKNIAQLLNPEYAREVKVNALLGSMNVNLIQRAKLAETEGFTCLKIKLGLTDLKTEAKALGSLLQQLSLSTLIRLDANKSWTLGQTEWLLNYLKPYEKQIDCIEEPLSTYDVKNYQYLQNKTNIALALDESFSSNSLKHFPVHRLVLKPMAQGGIINSYHLAKQAQTYKIETVITSSMETGYGLWPITHLCAAINNKQFHGLATASWLENTLIKPPEIKHGIITV